MTAFSPPLPVTLLVVAKAPVPGLAKTRLAQTIGDEAAAALAAAALLDTLDAALETSVQHRVVALTGDLADAVRCAEVRERLAAFTVIDQRGVDFAERLVNAHSDAARCDAATGSPVLQIGMDTPQVTPDLLADSARRLCDSDAVLGLAGDGGWWALGVSKAGTAACLRTVPMSQSDTGARTLEALRATGADVAFLPELDDVDTVADIESVRALCHPHSRFARVAVGV